VKQGKKESKEDIQYLGIKGQITSNQQILTDTFNDYFITIAENIYDSSRVSKTGQPAHDKYLNYMLKTSKIRFRDTSTVRYKKLSNP
jgi:hypothetical protein